MSHGHKAISCAVQYSDLGLYLMDPDDLARHAKVIKVLLGAVLRVLMY